ncbi:MAG: hypothetical protein ACFFCS_15115 [Candidatus Hodarchaeota archaeon]
MNESSFKERMLVPRIVGIITSFSGILFIMFGGVKNPGNFRVVSDLLQNFFILLLVLLVFFPGNKDIHVALYLGILSLVYDFLVEKVGIAFDLWHPLGGTQFPPFFNVPLEMVFSFFFIGISMAVILTFPRRFREMDFKLFNWLKPLFKNEKLDVFWQVLLVCVNTWLSTSGDFSADETIFILGSNWNPLFTVILNAWLYWGLLLVLLRHLLEKRMRSRESRAEPIES